jgi:hypothetical protein
MKKPSCKIILTAFAFFFASGTYSQNDPVTCADLKNGVFHSYPKNSADHYISEREDEYQKETNLTTGDTSSWQIKWKGNCTYSLKYLGGNKLPQEQLDFLKKHTLIYEVGRITNEYCLVTGHVDKTSNPVIQIDTMWFNERTNVISNLLFNPVPNAGALKRDHFSDTSKYAVVYIYRPKKLGISMSNYLVYFDDNIMWIAKNRSGAIFKILKEGRFEIKSKMLKDQSAVNVDVKFGNTYYIKSMVHWKLYKGYNFKLEMAQVEPEQGKSEFSEVSIQ